MSYIYILLYQYLISIEQCITHLKSAMKSVISTLRQGRMVQTTVISCTNHTSLDNIVGERREHTVHIIVIKDKL